MAKITGVELWAAAREALAVTSDPGDSDLARKLGLSLHGSQRVKRWRTGLNEPDFEGTIALLDALGAIRWEALDRPGSTEDAAEGLAEAAAAASRALEEPRARRAPRRGAA